MGVWRGGDGTVAAAQKYSMAPGKFSNSIVRAFKNATVWPHGRSIN
jgi:hypothetical protein